MTKRRKKKLVEVDKVSPYLTEGGKRADIIYGRLLYYYITYSEDFKYTVRRAQSNTYIRALTQY